MFYHSGALTKKNKNKKYLETKHNAGLPASSLEEGKRIKTTQVKPEQKHLDKLHRVANYGAVCQLRISNNAINQARKLRAVYQKSLEKPPVEYNLRINYPSICLSESLLQNASIFYDLTGCILEGSKFSVQL